MISITDGYARSSDGRLCDHCVHRADDVADANKTGGKHAAPRAECRWHKARGKPVDEQKPACDDFVPTTGRSAVSPE
jgi:hypothetical protein